MTDQDLGQREELTPAKVHKCDKCGGSFAWQTKSYGQGYYPVNIYWEGAIPYCYRRDFHSKTCGVDAPVEQPVETKPVVPEFSIGDVFTDIIENELQGIIEEETKSEVQSPFSNAELDTINKDIAYLESCTKVLKDKFAPVEDAMKQVDKDHAAFMEEVQQQVLKFSAQKAGLSTELRELTEAQKEIEARLRALGIEKNKHLEALAAKEKLLTLAKTLQDLWLTLPWYEAMKSYQNEDILYILNAWQEGKTGVLNANDTGLGKTFESGATLDLLSELFYRKEGRLPKVLWLTAKSLVGQTYRELLKWNDKRQMIVVGMDALIEGQAYTTIKMGADKKMREFQVDMAIQHNAWVITNYDALNTTPRILDVDWDFLVVDEVHKLKGGANCRNYSCDHMPGRKNCSATGLWRKTKEIIEKSKPFFIPLSATPVQNKPRDIWSVWHLFDSYHFPSVARFEREFCWEEWTPEGKKQRCDVERLIKVMKDQVIRRTKEEVNLDLPDKITEYDVDTRLPDEDEIYKMIRDNAFVKLEAMGDKPLTVSAMIAMFHYLRLANITTGSVHYKYEDLDGTVHEMVLPETESSKLTRSMEKVENLLAEGEQVVIYSTFTEPLHRLSKMINEAQLPFNGSNKPAVARVFTGEENAKNQTDSIVAGFQQGEFQVLCASIKAGGVGLNLQKSEQWPGGACNAIILDCWWNPAVMLQAEDRIHRQGQKDTVFIHYMTNEDSIDAFMANILAEKQKMMDGLLEREEIRPAFEWAEILKAMI